jgi:hypothetical protein
LYFLCQYTDVGPVAAVIGEAVEANTVVETTEKDNIVLESYVGPPNTAPSCETLTCEMAAA